MELKLKDIDINGKYIIKRTFDSALDGDKGLVLLRIDIGIKHQSPYHWFLKDNRKPPFDIALNPDNGICNYIKFFFQDEKILINNKNDIGIISKVIKGAPIFDITAYSEKNYHISENGIIITNLTNNNLSLLIENRNINICVNVDSKISFYFDKNNVFSGLEIISLTDSEIYALKNSDIL